MFRDPQFWVFVAFIIFIVAIFKPIKKIFLKNIDEKINDIKNSIDQAEKLRKDAQKTLIEIKKHQNEVKNEIKIIEDDARGKINFIENNLQKKVEEQIKKRRELAEVKINQMIRDANLEVQQYAAERAITATLSLLEEKLDQSQKQILIDNSVNELSSILKH